MGFSWAYTLFGWMGVPRPYVREEVDEEPYVCCAAFAFRLKFLNIVNLNVVMPFTLPMIQTEEE